MAYFLYTIIILTILRRKHQLETRGKSGRLSWQASYIATKRNPLLEEESEYAEDPDNNELLRNESDYHEGDEGLQAYRGISVFMRPGKKDTSPKAQIETPSNGHVEKQHAKNSCCVIN